MYHVEVISLDLPALSQVAQAFSVVELFVKSVPKKQPILSCIPSRALLSNCKPVLPGIVFVIFVHVSAVKAPVANGYILSVPSLDLKYPLKSCATLDFTQKDKVI